MSTSKALLDLQNGDGGWSYSSGGGSWTEATCYALLALVADGRGDSDAVIRGVRWLSTSQRPDGGWPPRQTVTESTWVTALVLLLPAALPLNRNSAVTWLLKQTGKESSFVRRLRLRLLGARPDPQFAFDGWPWYPGTAAWVTPTALSILALEKLHRASGDERARQRIEAGRAFLFARRCRDGGWNHGSTRALGYDSDSYPETTGAALLALHNSNVEGIDQAVVVAERHLASCKSQEAASWLTLALTARGKTPLAPTLASSHGGTTGVALAGLAEAACDGRNAFLD